jgi:hypothetical protein
MIAIPEFPPPNREDPDEVGWPMCTAAAYWRQGRYDEAIREVESAAKAARERELIARANELATAAATLLMYVQSEDADPRSVPVSREYPTLELMAAIEAEIAREELEPPSPAIPTTLPSGIFGAGARPSKLRRLFPKPVLTSPLVLDFNGSFLGRAPPRDENDPPLTRRSDPPPKK